MSNRRKFIADCTLATGSFALMSDRIRVPESRKLHSLKLHMFSKHLQFLDYFEMASVISKIGFDGVDLTVRKGGHVEPQNVKRDLPRAVEAMRSAGIDSISIVTDVMDIRNSENQDVLETAAKLDIRLYRMAYFDYIKHYSIIRSIEYYQKHLRELRKFNEKLGIIGCYQNHSGIDYIGASIWELYRLLEREYSQVMGIQYDIRHAVVEGGLSWSRGFQLVEPMVRSLAIKDFKWKINKLGKWVIEDVPIGDGMVDFKFFFSLLKTHQIDVPMSVYMEYFLGGAEHGAIDINVAPAFIFNAMERDLKMIRKLWADV